MRPLMPCALRGLALLLLVLCRPMLGGAEQPAADEHPGPILSGEQIQQALRPPRTRDFTPRGLARREQVSQAVNLNIQFEHNSSALQAAASQQLHQLQLALTSEALRGDRFLVAGHTDAKGDPQYNKRLSLRRAEAVKRFLITAGVDGHRLQTVGYGSERLLAPERPYDSRNRRVEIRDLGGTTP